MALEPARHGQARPLTARDIADEPRLRRWQRERDYLEQASQDQRVERRKRLILMLIVCFLLLDVAISFAVIQSITK
ncbi:MAG: hypothetical protein ABIP57_17800 [Jatrophihabitantaceae bacterium]